MLANEPIERYDTFLTKTDVRDANPASGAGSSRSGCGRLPASRDHSHPIGR
jgi:hypothetical protein